jgi:hypothetical protein
MNSPGPYVRSMRYRRVQLMRNPRLSKQRDFVRFALCHYMLRYLPEVS